MAFRLVSLFSGIGFLISSFGVTAGVSPYLPLKLNPVFELEVERLVTVTGYPALRKPYHIATMVDYLDKVKLSHPKLHGRINRYIERFKTSANITHLKTEIRIDGSTPKTLKNARGRSTDNTLYSEFSAFWQASEYVIANVSGGYGNQDGSFNFGNFISIGSDYLQVDIGYREHWLSPFQDQSMIISTQAKPMLGITLSNVEPITDFDITYEISFGELKKVDGISFNGVESSGKPGLLTMNFGFKPFDWWTASLSRTLQFGGGARGDINTSSIWDAITEPVDSNTCDDQLSLQNCDDFGNQQIAIGSRFDLSWNNLPYSLILEVASEEAANYKIDKVAYSLGLFIPYLSQTESLNITAQFIEDGWYVHRLYQQGYTNDNHIIGHWWGDEKGLNDASDANILSVKYTNDLSSTSHFSVKYSTIENNVSEDDLAVNYDRGHYLELDYNWQYKAHFLGLHLYAGKDINGDSFSSLAFSRMW